MSLEPNSWQPMAGMPDVDFYPLITRPSIHSSNCYLFSARDVIVVIAPGADTEQTKLVNQTVGHLRVVPR